MPPKVLRDNPTIRMEFYLARELGMTRAELLRRMSAAEFAHWIAFYQIEAQERERSQQQAEDKARARAMAGRMR